MAIKKNQTIPSTVTRLKNGLAVFMGAYDGTKPLTDAELLSTPVKEIGMCTGFKYNNDRKGSGKYRVFDSQSYGKILEAYPGLPDYALSFQNAIWYKNSLQEYLGYGAADVGYMDKPHIIQLVLLAPDGQAIRVWSYRSCWLDNNTWEFDADPSDLYMNQDITVVTAGVIEGTGE